LDSFERAYKEIVDTIQKTFYGLKSSQVQKMLQSLMKVRENNKKILVVGAGRSGLVGKAFAMRLMHLGFNVFVLSETITPYVGEGDMVLVISGSGKTTVPLTAAKMAKELGSIVLAITSHDDSPLAKTADLVVNIPGRRELSNEHEYNVRQLRGTHESLAPMGTIFEDTSMIFLDSIIAELMNRLNFYEEVMRKRHATIE
jgi:6-phospho-3-hexuloisomerase